MVTAAVAASVIALAGSVFAIVYLRELMLAARARKGIADSLAAGKCLLFFMASRLELDGVDVQSQNIFKAGGKSGLLVDSGSHISYGDYEFREKGMPSESFSSERLDFELDPVKEYVLGVFPGSKALEHFSVSCRRLGEEEEGRRGVALACGPCAPPVFLAEKVTAKLKSVKRAGEQNEGRGC
jgi:hypothetical protein